jgi:drug/metabolite transporter (DMT)-like permease
MGEPILASLLALVILGESPTPIKMLGGVIVLVGIWLATKSSGVQPQVSETLPRQEAGPGGRQADA